MAEPLIQVNQIVPNPSPLWTDANVSNAGAAQVIGANIQRRGLMFANPGSQILYVAPVGAALAIGHGVPIFPGAEPLWIARENFQINVAWQAIAAAGTTNVLTILEFV